MRQKILLTLLLSTLCGLAFSITPDSSAFRRPLPPRTHKPLPKVHLQQRDQLTLTNLVVFIRFADDEEITQTFDNINNMFNDQTEGAESVYNYFDAMSYGKIHYNTVYTNQINGSTVVSYCDPHPRSYFEPYSASNPNGYPPFPAESVCPREMQLLADALHYIDSLHLVDPSINLDGNDDGLIDNVSFIIKGGCGNWADLLWPHMEFFSQDSLNLPYTIAINGKIPYTYNFELEASGYYFSANVFCHEMCHSLGLPDFYHYYHYTSISPVSTWDIMGQNCLQQLSTILKYKFLGIVDEPIEITEDGTYTLYSNAGADYQNCYYIRSAIDSTQWYTFEYRNKNDFMDNVSSSGLIVGRWVDTMDVNDIYNSGDAMFDFYNSAHGYWVFRPGSNVDTINGDVYRANFTQNELRTSFGPTTDPHPYLTDGTPETSFEITDIREEGSTLSFHVHFLNVGIAEQESDRLRIYPNPASDQLYVEGSDIQSLSLCDLLGKTICTLSGSQNSINISTLPSGVYWLRVTTSSGIVTKKIVKK